MRRKVVQRWPAVPTQAKVADLTTISRSASSSTIKALLPPNSKRCLPKRSCTVKATLLPTGVLPVNETNLTRGSAAMAWPTSVAPWHNDTIPPGRPFFSKTEVTILVVATDTKGVDGAPFQIMQLPHTMAMALFQPNTATWNFVVEFYT